MIEISEKVRQKVGLGEGGPVSADMAIGAEMAIGADVAVGADSPLCGADPRDDEPIASRTDPARRTQKRLVGRCAKPSRGRGHT